MENVIIIGGGPAGLSAALYTARANLSPLVFAGSPPGGQLMLTSEVENYPGFESVLGPDLIEKYRTHVKKFGTKLIDQNISKVDFSQSPFSLTSDEKTYQSKAVIIATGAKALWLNLPNEQRLRGRGVSACATCDGFFFKNKAVVVIGGGDTAMEEALTLTQYASKVYIIHRRGEFRASKIMQDRVFANKKIEVIWNTEVVDVIGQNKVEGIKIRSRQRRDEIRNLSVDGLFLAIGHKPDTDLFKGQVELDQKGYIVTKNNKGLFSSYTSVEGVFAAGDCVDYIYRQAGTAAGMGIAAALDAQRWLELKVNH